MTALVPMGAGFIVGLAAERLGFLEGRTTLGTIVRHLSCAIAVTILATVLTPLVVSWLLGTAFTFGSYLMLGSLVGAASLVGSFLSRQRHVV
jgi:hypothetical protein